MLDEHFSAPKSTLDRAKHAGADLVKTNINGGVIAIGHLSAPVAPAS